MPFFLYICLTILVICYSKHMFTHDIFPVWLRNSPEWILKSCWTSKPSRRSKVGSQPYVFIF